MWFAIVAVLMAGVAIAQPDLAGVYQPISDRTTLPGGLKNRFSCCRAASAGGASASQIHEPEIGSLENVPGRWVLSGCWRRLRPNSNWSKLRMRRGHPQKFELTWEGDSVGRWEGDTLVVDTVGFNDRTWLNEEGAQHSDALHLVERIRPILAGKYLEYKMTAEDPKTLARPYTYTRYYERVTAEIMDDVCEDEQ